MNINFDLDGTLVDLYGVDGWLDDLLAERTRPYEQARPLVNMQTLARTLNRLTRAGYEINVVSWTSKCGSAEYNERVAQAKREWLARHLASVRFTHIDILDYGTPKQIGREGILFDDETPNREAWGEGAYDVENIIEILKSLK